MRNGALTSPQRAERSSLLVLHADDAGEVPSMAERARERERGGTELEMMVSVWGLGVKGEEVCKVEEATTKTLMMVVNGRDMQHQDRCVARQVSFLMLLAPLHCCMAHDPVSDLGERRLKGERDGPNAFILQPVPPLSFLISFKRPQNPKASLSLISGRRST